MDDVRQIALDYAVCLSAKEMQTAYQIITTIDSMTYDDEHRTLLEAMKQHRNSKKLYASIEVANDHAGDIILETVKRSVSLYTPEQERGLEQQKQMSDAREDIHAAEFVASELERWGLNVRIEPVSVPRPNAAREIIEQLRDRHIRQGQSTTNDGSRPPNIYDELYGVLVPIVGIPGTTALSSCTIFDRRSEGPF